MELALPSASWRGKLWMVRSKDRKELDEKLFLSLPTNYPQILHDYSLLSLQRLSMEPTNSLCFINYDKFNSMPLAFSPSFYCLMLIHPRIVFSCVSMFAWVLKHLAWELSSLLSAARVTHSGRLPTPAHFATRFSAFYKYVSQLEVGLSTSLVVTITIIPFFSFHVFWVYRWSLKFQSAFGWFIQTNIESLCACLYRSLKRESHSHRPWERTKVCSDVTKISGFHWQN